MSAFRVVDHKIPCQYIREYPRALANEQEDTLHLAVKQYIPIDNPYPQPGDVTIIGAHANAFAKELYEPLWDDLLARAKEQNWRIRSIWVADVAHQGASGLMNESQLGNDPSWLDHARDLLHVINEKRGDMPRPLVGIGHSMGGASLVNLAYIHPRLLTTLILLDPVMEQTAAGVAPDPPSADTNKTRTPTIAQMSTFRRDTWPSRSKASDSFSSSPMYKTWDARVLEKFQIHGLRDLPTPLYPDRTAPEVTLATPTSQEVFTFLRPNYNNYGAEGIPINRETHADLNPQFGHPRYPFYRHEPILSFLRLPAIRPSTLYIYGANSTSMSPESRRDKVAQTGIGVGGSGGVKEGRVKQVTFEGVGHLVAQEAPTRTAGVIAEWIETEMVRWREIEDRHRREWIEGKSQREKQEIDAEWKKHMGGGLKRRKKDSKI